MTAEQPTPKARSSASLQALVAEELRSTMAAGESGAATRSVELGSATYTKMLGKRTP